MKKMLSMIMLLLLPFMLLAAFDPDRSDYLFYNMQSYQEDYDYLSQALSSCRNDAERAEILWRLARTRLTLTDGIDEGEKKARLSGYEESQRLAEESIDYKETADGYHWLSSAIGRIGQVNGPLNSLSKAKPMRGLIEKVQNDFNADMSDSWYVLSLLYNQLPGSPLSFGNKNYAISYMRRCIDTQDNVNRTNLTNYLELAEQLYDRDWNASRRAKELDKMEENYQSNSVPTEKMKYYEGRDGRDTQPFYSAVRLGDFSDEQEAIMLCQYALAVYNLKTSPLPSEIERAGEIQAFLDRISR